MSDDLQQRIQQAIANPKNLGEMENADSVGTVGSPDCGDMLRMWVKFKRTTGKEGHRPRDVSDLRLRDGDRGGERRHGIDRRQNGGRGARDVWAAIFPRRSARCRR